MPLVPTLNHKSFQFLLQEMHMNADDDDDDDSSNSLVVDDEDDD